MDNFPTTPRIFFRKIFDYRINIYLYKMKRLNSNSIFDIFSATDQEVYQEHNVGELLKDPVIRLGTVVMGVESYHLMDLLYTKKLGEKYLSNKENIKLRYFTDLMQYVGSIEDIQSDTLSIIEEEFGREAIVYALEEMIEVFVLVEHCEKCAILQKYFDLFSLKKLEDC